MGNEDRAWIHISNMTLRRLPLLAVLFLPSFLRADTVESFLRHQMVESHIPGLQIAVVRHGKIVLLKSFGIANLEDGTLVTDRTVFPIHSITKAFTGVAAMQLAEAGKLDFSAPVSRYLEDLPSGWRHVTIRQLMTHTSGIPDIWDEHAVMIDRDPDKAWAKVKALPMEFAPGERFKYNQANYILIGKVIDKLSGQPFARFIARQFKAVGMPGTSFGDGHDVVPRLSGTYTLSGGELKNFFLDWPPFIRTAVGINTTAEDLAKWSIAVQKGKLLKSKSSLDTMWTAGRLNDGSHKAFGAFVNGYGLGWQLAIRPKHRAIVPTGGGRAAMFIYPDDDLTVVILTNLLGEEPGAFVDEVAGYYIPDLSLATGFGFPPAIKTLHIGLQKHGVIDVARARKMNLQEIDVNFWGYRLMKHDLPKEAVKVFKLNVDLFPKSANTYDSLAEAYQVLGNKPLAIKNYMRSLQLDPKNTNAVEHLRQLRRR